MATAARTIKNMLVVRDPEDGAIVGELAITSRAEVDQALARGYSASRRSPPPAHERARILRQVADLVAADAERHAELIAREGIKTIREARAEVRRAVVTLTLSAEEAKRLGGAVIPFDQVPSGEGRIGWWTARPAGLVAAITPYNDPLNLVAHKLGPAFAAGCPIVLKPHPQTPFSAVRLAEHFYASGAEEDRIQIVIGDADIGRAMVGDERPRIVSFTGGRAAGKQIANSAGMKQLILELGGVGIVGVASDADLDRAAEAIHSGAFWAAGQNCVRAQRIIADQKIAGELTDRLVARAANMRLGPKLDETTDMGPLVDAVLADTLGSSIKAMEQAGGTVLTGGKLAGTRLLPTWIAGLPAGSPSLDCEMFGPVSTIETARDDADLLDRIGQGSDAIHCAIFTESISLAMETFQRSNSAALLVNDSTDYRIDAMPFGGIGAAGLGREGVADAVMAMSEKKLMIVARS